MTENAKQAAMDPGLFFCIGRFVVSGIIIPFSYP